jgi:PPOX class probable F420-dependent enzyme
VGAPRLPQQALVADRRGAHPAGGGTPAVETDKVSPAGSGAAPEEVRERVSRARVGRLATVREDHRPHIVPVTFALDGDMLVSAVDQKPKRTHDLLRLRNIDANPAVSLLIDQYDDEWSRLWWIRLDGVARIVRAEPTRSAAARPLVDKYQQYRDAPPAGPVVQVRVTSWTWWSATCPE